MKFKDYITHKRATYLLKRVNTLLSGGSGEVKIEETIDYGKRIEKTLIIKVSMFFFKAETFTKLVELLIKENAKISGHYYAFHEKDIVIKVKIRR